LAEGRYAVIPDVRNPTTILDPRTYGMWNDQLSSVQVPAGVTVTLYRDSNFGGGDPLVLHSDDPDLTNDMMRVSWDNQASAIKVSGGSVTVYDNPTNTLGTIGNIGSIGNVFTLNPGTMKFEDTGGQVVNLDSTWNDRISAIGFP